jgi:DNA-binding transcriptional LysR family regulator
MNLDDLAALVAFVRHGSVSRAAEHLHLTQPAVTRRIQSLESAIGGTLLDRSVKPPRVSALGMRVYERCQAVFREIDGLRELTREDGELHGTLRVGAAQSVSDATVVSAVTRLKRRFPRLRVEMQTAWSPILLKRVRTGELDAAAIMVEQSVDLPEGVVGDRVGSHRMVVVAWRSFKPRRPVPLCALSAYPWVVYPEGCVCRAALQRAFEARGLGLQIAVSDYGVEHQLALVAVGTGLGLVPEVMLESSRHRAKLREIRTTDFALEIGIWVIRPAFLGQLAGPVGCFKEVVAAGFGTPRTTPARRRRTNEQLAAGSGAAADVATISR